MTRFTKIIGIIALLALCGGCCTSKSVFREGDFAAFFLMQALKFGAKPVNTNAPPLHIEWQYQEDKNGFQVKTAKRNFASIERFLHHSFGEPAMPVKHTTDMTMGVYAAREVGVAIQFGMEGSNSFVTLLRGLSQEEVFSGMTKALGNQDKNKTNSPPRL
jgi:hypothetical protein